MMECSYITALIGVGGTLLGVIVGTIITRYFMSSDKRRAYITNAQNVLLTFSKQINELQNIRDQYEALQTATEEQPNLKRYLISESDWRLSKTEIAQLNSGDWNLMLIIFDLIIEVQKFKILLDMFQDRNNFIEPIERRIYLDPSASLSMSEIEELSRLNDAIDSRIDDVNLSVIANKLHSYFCKKYPYEKFPRSQIISDTMSRQQQE